GGLGAKGKQIADVFKGVHLFRDDIGVGADGAGEEGSLLEDGEANVGEIVGFEDVAGGLLDAIPEGRGGRKDVADAFDGADLFWLAPLALSLSTKREIGRAEVT